VINAGKKDARLLDTLGFDVPACEIVLEDAEETLLRIVALFGTAEQSETWTEKEEKEGPKEEIGKGHEVGDALEHASGLEDKGGEGNAGEIHADSAARMSGWAGSMASTQHT